MLLPVHSWVTKAILSQTMSPPLQMTPISHGSPHKDKGYGEDVVTVVRLGGISLRGRLLWTEEKTTMAALVDWMTSCTWICVVYQGWVSRERSPRMRTYTTLGRPIKILFASCPFMIFANTLNALFSTKMCHQSNVRWLLFFYKLDQGHFYHN